MNTKNLKNIDFSLNERIDQFMNALDLKAADLVKSGVSNQQYISNVRTKKRTTNVDFCTRLLFAYPELRWQWLLGGEGEMLYKKNYNTSDTVLGMVNEESVCLNPDCRKKIDDLKDELNNANKLIISLQSELLILTKKEKPNANSAQYRQAANE